MSADIFVYLDTVQFSKNGLQNRNQIKTAQGPLWLTLPVRHEFGQSILETRIADSKAKAKHWKTLAASYARTPGFEIWKSELESLLNQPTDSLCEISIASTEWLLTKLDVKTRRLRASEIPGTQGEASELVASLCNTLGADVYLTGTGALQYLQPEDFSNVKCEVMVQEWQSFEYPQAHVGAGFVPGLSTLDLLLNLPTEAAHLINEAGDWRPLRDTV
jgi:hypothetical protein